MVCEVPVAEKVNGAVTFTLTAVEVAALYVLSPEYLAVMLCAPAALKLTEREACPPLTVTGVPKAVVPSMNCTVPVGMIVPNPGKICACKLNCCPATGLRGGSTSTVGLPFVIVMASGELFVLLELKLLSPP